MSLKQAVREDSRVQGNSLQTGTEAGEHVSGPALRQHTERLLAVPCSVPTCSEPWFPQIYSKYTVTLVTDWLLPPSGYFVPLPWRLDRLKYRNVFT